MAEILQLLFLGALAGSLAGLLGVGGGVIIVPALIWIFQTHPEIPASSLMHIAIGTSLATIILTSVSSIFAHHRRKAIYWSIVWQLTPGILLGAWSGATVADALPSKTLHFIFALFILMISVQLSLVTQPTSHRQLPSRLGITMVGLIIGSVSAIVGIGGGSLTVPFLAWCNVPLRNAVATSAACGFPIALSGTIGFIVMGWNVTTLPSGSTGYIYWPAFLTIAITSLLFAPLGAKLAHTVPVNLLKRFFALFLAGVGIKMLVS